MVQKNPIWKNWRLWVVIIIVFTIIGVFAGPGEKTESPTKDVNETSIKTENKLDTMGATTVRMGKCAVLKVADKVAKGKNLENISYSILGHISECHGLQKDAIDAGNIAEYNSELDVEWENRKDEQLNGHTLTYWLQDWANN